MANTYVYLIGGSLDSLDLADRKQIVKMGLNLEGYCDLGWAEGYAIYGTLPKLKKFVEDYIGVEIVDDYLFEEDVFEDMSSDADWKDINFQSWELLNTFKKGFGESKKVSRKSIKESSSAYKEFLKNYKIKGELKAEVDDMRNGKQDFYYGEVYFEKDGIYVKDTIDGGELFIDGDDIIDYIDVGMGASDFAFNVGDGKTITRFSIHVTILRKFRNNIVRNF